MSDFDSCQFILSSHEACVRVGVRYVITKFSRMDSLSNFLTHGAPSISPVDHYWIKLRAYRKQQQQQQLQMQIAIILTAWFSP